MIPVALAPEPQNFDLDVRQKGLDAIAELIGQAPSRKRKGPKRAKIANRPEDIPADAFPPYWRDALPDMLQSYSRVCAYLSLYIERATGSASVDHMVAKSKAWDRVYEWSNYRLACALINSKKNDFDLALDPCGIKRNVFALEFVAFQVIPGAAAKGALLQQAQNTIEMLGLNMHECCEARREYVESYENGHIDLAYLQRRAPFIAYELGRQGLLNPSDTPSRR